MPGRGSRAIVGVDRHLAGPHAGAGQHAEAGHDEGADADGDGAVPRPLLAPGCGDDHGRPSAPSSGRRPVVDRAATSGGGRRPGAGRVDRHRRDRRDRTVGGHGVFTIDASGGFVAGGRTSAGRHRPDRAGGARVRAGRGTVRAGRAYGRRRRGARRRGSRRRGWGGGSPRRPRRRRRRTPGPITSPTVHGPMPLTRDNVAASSSWGRRTQRHSRSAMRATSVSARARLASMPERVEPPGRAAGQAFGARREQRARGRDPGGRLAELVAQPGPLPHGLAAGDALGQDRRQQGVVEVAAGARAHAGEAAGGVGEQAVVVGQRGRRAVDAGHRQRPRRGRGRRRAPRRRCAAGPTSRGRRAPARRASSRPGPSPVACSDVVGSPRPWRYHDRVRARSDRRRRAGGDRCDSRGPASSRRTAVGIGPERTSSAGAGRGRPRSLRRPIRPSQGRPVTIGRMSVIEISHPKPGVVQVTLNRPERLNAMTSELVDRPARDARRHRRRSRGPRRRS